MGYLESPEDVHTYQGRDYAYIGFDEACNIPMESYLYMFSRLRSPNPNIPKRIRITGNPDGPYVLAYYDRFVGKLSPGETKYYAGAEDKEVSPKEGTSRCWIECRRAENTPLMENDPDYEKRLDILPEEKRNALKYGLWIFNDDPKCLFKTSWITKARAGLNEFKAGHYAIGFDFAHLGNDKTVLVKGYGNRVLEIKSWGQTEHTQAADIIADEMEPYGLQINCGLDSNGTGAGVYSILKGDKYKRYIDRVIPLAAKDRAFDQAIKIKYDNRIKFLNVRSQIYWRLKEDLERGDIDLSPLAGTKELGFLLKELSEIHWTDDKGYIQIEDKAALRKRIKRSTDFLDALAYWNWARHIPIQLPSLDLSDKYMSEIDYGRYADNDNYDSEENDSMGDGSDIGSW